jgi:N-acyl-D-aspartate/D-glutamate deacylase
MAKVDLVIRGGTVADGTGNALREADVAVDGGKIVAVGKVAESGREEIAAKGRLVTPGFVDLHTHYDAQLTWSDTLNPSSQHGVTTVVTGNCGVGFAPCRPDDREQLIRIMDGVEDIPEAIMADGLPWDWETFGEFLDSVDRRPHDIDFAVLQPHAPLRCYVMGSKRAMDMAPATEAERAKMRVLARTAMAAGGAGFSTSRNIFHKASDGSYLPTMKAEEAELEAIARGMSDAGRGILQGTMVEEYKVDEYEFMHRVAMKTGRPLSYTVIQIDWAQQLWRDVIAAVERDNAAGAKIKMQIFNRPVGLILGLEASLNPFCFAPYYVEHLAKLPVPERVARMRDPEVRRILMNSEYTAKHPFAPLIRRFERTYLMGDVADYEPDPSTSIAALAAAQNVAPDAVAYDALLANDGKAKLFLASANYGLGNLDPTLELMKHKDSVVALGDGGAHYGIVSDASYSTFMLTHWVRDRKRGERLDLAKAVSMLTDSPARAQGFLDRGRIAPGMKADINVIDFDRLTLYSPSLIQDLPAGGKRLIQNARGFEATLVGGVPIRRDDQDTGARPGRLVRNAIV